MAAGARLCLGIVTLVVGIMWESGTVVGNDNCNCDCSCKPEISIQEGCCDDRTKASSGPHPVLVRKWARLFDYSNLVQQTDGGAEVLNYADYNAMRTNLANSALSSVADQVAALSYPPPLHDPTSTEGPTKPEFIASMYADYQAGKLTDRTFSDTMYDLMTGLPSPLGGTPMKRSTLVAFEVAVGAITAADAEAYIDKMTTGDTIDKTLIADWLVIYLSDDSSPLEDMPIFGPDY